MRAGPAPAPDFAHLLHLTDGRATFEHAQGAEPRPEHGYCTDDMARVVVVAAREPHPSPEVRGLVETGLRFLGDAQGVDGDYRNRMLPDGRWSGRRSAEDCWGRSLWGLGTAAAYSPVDWVRQTAVAQFERGAHQRPAAVRSLAFAALGAAELLSIRPDHRAAKALLADAADWFDRCALPADDAAWPWPEARLSYANAVVPEAMIATGDGLGRPDLVARGLGLLAWLLGHEAGDGHLSVTPSGGAGPDDVRPGFDQQPIEVAALADACARAAQLDDDRRWAQGVAAAVDWFLGDNDSSVVMWDPATGGGFDGLEPGAANRNQGAESTLALLSTLQHARYLVPAGA
jgi:hypothetical protein